MKKDGRKIHCQNGTLWGHNYHDYNLFFFFSYANVIITLVLTH
jgi:hypothetical protein